MKSKSEIENLIDTNLADDSQIPAELHREVEYELVNELYGTQVVDTNSTPAQAITSVIANAGYNIELVKQGGICHVSGSFRPITSHVGNTQMLMIIDPLFNPKTGLLIREYPASLRDDNNISVFAKLLRFTYNSGSDTWYINSVNGLGANQTVYFNFSYPLE